MAAEIPACTSNDSIPKKTTFPSNDKQPAFDTFVFDLDGTLLDTLPDLVVLTNAALAEFGFPTHTPEAVQSFVGNGARALIYQAVPQDATSEQVEAVTNRWKELYSSVGDKLTQPYPYIMETLSELKRRGVRLAVLSNKFDRGVHDVIAKYMPDTFEVLHGECDEIPRKPNPAGLLRTIRELNSTPERTVYVGDSDGDVKVAKNAGAFSIGAAWGYHRVEHLHDAGVDVVIDDARELLRYARSV